MDVSNFGLAKALAEGRSFSAAARRLGVAHTTVARRLRQLEAYYGTRLFENAPEGLTPTPAGERVLESAERIDAEIMGLERGIKGSDQRLAGSVRLTTVDVLAWHFMGRIAAFRTAYPEIDLSIETGTELRSLSRREAEMALRLTNRPDEFLFGRRIGRFDFLPYAHATLLARLGHDAADQLPWIDYNGRDCGGPAGRWMKSECPNVRPLMSVPTPLMMLRAIGAGAGVGLLPTSVAVEQPDLVPISDKMAFSVDIWLLAPQELRHTARIRAVFAAFC